MLQIIRSASSFSFLFLNILLIFSGVCFSQKSIWYNGALRDYFIGKELYSKEKYGASHLKLDEFLTSRSPVAGSPIDLDAETYSILCALKLNNADAVHRADQFLTLNSETRNAHLLAYETGNYFYAKKSYAKAILWYEKTDASNFTMEIQGNYFFSLGHSRLKKGDVDGAFESFERVLKSNTRFYYPALYYRSHILYEKSEYEEALKGFYQLADHQAFAAISPYYITQIYYMKHQFDSVIKYATPLIDTLSSGKKTELARLVGQSYYEKKEFDNSIKYFELVSNTSTLGKHQLYKLGYSYYQMKNYKDAARTFGKITEGEDTVAQNACYHLGVVYIEMGDKKKARDAFSCARMMSFDPAITEDALYNYAKLSYDLSYFPHENAVGAFVDYIEKYPESPKVDEAFQFLVKVFLTTKNYKEALTAINKIINRTVQIEEAHQRVAYYYGIQLFNDNELSEAVAHFNLSIELDPVTDIAAQCYYWKAEAEYRLRLLDKAADNYRRYILHPKAIDTKELAVANYNLGYCYFEKEEFVKATIWFKRYLQVSTDGNKERQLDGNLRLADCYYMRKNYEQAIVYYDLVAVNAKTDADYASFQKALALGGNRQGDLKIKELQKLLKEFTSSSLRDDAMFQLAETYLANGSYAQALDLYDQVAFNYPTGSFASKSYLQKSLVYRNTFKDSLAVLALKDVVRKFPSTADALVALNTLKNIAVNIGDVDIYLDFVADLNLGELSDYSHDSLTYEAAEIQFLNGNCKMAVQNFNNYLSKFSKGLFWMNAHYYRAECMYSMNNMEEALVDYEPVIENNVNPFLEKALSRSASILMQKGDTAKAYNYYKRLVQIAEKNENIRAGYIGLMYGSYSLKKYVETLTYSNRVLQFEKLKPETRIETYSLLARSGWANNDTSLAKINFKKVAEMSKGEMGAEARYFLADIYYLEGDMKKAEELIDGLIKEFPSYSKWLAKGYVLLSDILWSQGDYFQAKHTLRSIIENYPGKELKQVANQKYNLIIEEELRLNSFKDSTDQMQIIIKDDQ